MPPARSRSVADRGVPKPRSDAYVGLLGLSLLALTAAMVFAYLNWTGISTKPKPLQVAPKGGGAAGGVAPAVPQAPPAPGAGQPGAPAPAPQPGVPPPAPGKQPGPPPAPGKQPAAPQPK
ncbi:MAG TPA: hypothetical protein VH682_18225 [Gemmataceae bacterium]